MCDARRWGLAGWGGAARGAKVLGFGYRVPDGTPYCGAVRQCDLLLMVVSSVGDDSE